MTPTPAPDEAYRCEDCDHTWYYTRPRCSSCGGVDWMLFELTDGTVLQWTSVTVTPPDVRSPNHLGLVRFDDLDVIAQLVDDDIAVGDRVAFTGTYALRAGADRDSPRLQRIADETAPAAS